MAGWGDTDMLFSVAGGLGLFLLGMQNMTDGMKLAAGDNLASWLAAGTRTPLRALLSGMLVTVLLQSSGVVSVLLLGFIGGGLMQVERAVYVLYGANIATTSTAWLVALAGFNFRFEHYALPLIGVGAMFYLFRKESRDGAIGQAVLGFGLFCLGLAYLKQAFGGMGHGVPLAFDAAWQQVLVFAGIGFVVTVLMQSSSAASAVTISAVTGGAVGLDTAAAMLIGANVGSTTTGLLASLRADRPARLLAVWNLAFNAATAVIAVLLLKLMLWSLEAGCAGLAGGCPVTVQVAGFNTLFNVMGVLVFWPFTHRMVRLIDRHFPR